MRYQAQRGTYDVTPANAHRWQHVESAFRSLVERYGYQEVRTPTFEDTELFVRSSGDTSEVVTKQMYTFLDKGERSLTLKPEGTAPAIRAYLEHSLGQSGAVTRLWYKTPIFRYERPQKGRCREAHQVGLELIGSPSPAADAEVIEITVRYYESLGVREPKVLLNCIGREETRSAYRDALLAVAEPVMREMSTEDRARAVRNPLRLLDSKDPSMKAALATAPPITDFLEAPSRAHFDKLQQLLSEASIPFALDASVVRGLDYYTDTVFEVHSTALGAQSALCGGGRYDGLVSELGGPPTPSVGVAMGLERLIIVMDELKLPSPTQAMDAYIVAAEESAIGAVRELARSLRAAGLSVMHDLDNKSMRAQMKAADRLKSKWTILIGGAELEAGAATLRRMDSGDQRSVPMNEVEQYLRCESSSW